MTILINGMLPDRENSLRIPELGKQIAVREAFSDLRSIFENQHPINSPERPVFEILTRHNPDIPKNTDPTLIRAEELLFAEMRWAGSQPPTRIVFTPLEPDKKILQISQIIKAMWVVNLRQIDDIRRPIIHALNKTIQRVNAGIANGKRPHLPFADLNIRNIEDVAYSSPFSVVLPKDSQDSVSGFVNKSPFTTGEILGLVEYFENYKLYTPPAFTRQELREAA